MNRIFFLGFIQLQHLLLANSEQKNVQYIGHVSGPQPLGHRPVQVRESFGSGPQELKLGCEIHGFLGFSRF